MKKIYLIDDDPFYLKVLSKKLWEWGYAVKTFLSVEDALPNMTEQPDLIVLDHNFSSSNSKGADYIPLLKRHARNAALIYVTTESSPDIIQRSLKKGADTYLTKDKELYTKIHPVIEELIAKRATRKTSFWSRLFG